MSPLSLRTPMGALGTWTVLGVREPDNGLDVHNLKPSLAGNPKPFCCRGSGLPCGH